MKERTINCLLLVAIVVTAVFAIAREHRALVACNATAGTLVRGSAFSYACIHEVGR
jgi:hypothetical protein